jgi:hypothetical protein
MRFRAGYCLHHQSNDSPDYTVLHPRRQPTLYTLPWEPQLSRTLFYTCSVSYSFLSSSSYKKYATLLDIFLRTTVLDLFKKTIFWVWNIIEVLRFLMMGRFMCETFPLDFVRSLNYKITTFRKIGYGSLFRYLSVGSPGVAGLDLWVAQPKGTTDSILSPFPHTRRGKQNPASKRCNFTVRR